MIKFIAESDQADAIYFGLSNANLDKLMQGKPIPIIGYAGGNRDFLIIAGQDQDAIEDQCKQIAKRIGQQSVQILSFENRFYLLSLIGDSRALFVIGLTLASYALLRDRQALYFRCTPDKMKPFTVNIIWGPTEEHMEEWLAKNGIKCRSSSEGDPDVNKIDH